MRDRVRDAFDKIRASQELKDRTAAFAAEEIHRRSRGKKILPIRRIISLAAALTVLLLGAGFLRSYYTVSAAISVDADASLKLEVNCFDRVISVEGYGEEGQSLAEDLDLKHRSYRAALETLLNSRKLREQLSRDSAMEITVTGTDPEQAEEILQTASDDTEGSENIRCQAGNSLEAEEAAKAGLPLGKYRAYLELLELDPEVTPEEVADLTMREIRSRIDALQGTAAQTESSAYTSDETEPSEAGSEPAESSSPAESQTGNSGNGQGQGHRNSSGENSGAGNQTCPRR